MQLQSHEVIKLKKWRTNTLLPKPPHSAKLSKTPGSVYRVYRVLYTAAAMQPADQADPGPRTMAAAATLS